MLCGTPSRKSDVMPICVTGFAQVFDNRLLQTDPISVRLNRTSHGSSNYRRRLKHGGRSHLRGHCGVARLSSAPFNHVGALVAWLYVHLASWHGAPWLRIRILDRCRPACTVGGASAVLNSRVLDPARASRDDWGHSSVIRIFVVVRLWRSR
jgi:hypothetical protein